MKKVLVVTWLVLALALSAGLESAEKDYVKEREDQEKQDLLKCIAELAKETNPELKELTKNQCDTLVEAAAIVRQVQRDLDKNYEEYEKTWTLPHTNVIKERLLGLLAHSDYTTIKDERRQEKIFTAILETYLPPRYFEADRSTQLCFARVVMDWFKGPMESDLSLPKVAEECQSAMEGWGQRPTRAR